MATINIDCEFKPTRWFKVLSLLSRINLHKLFNNKKLGELYINGRLVSIHRFIDGKVTSFSIEK